MSFLSIRILIENIEILIEKISSFFGRVVPSRQNIEDIYGCDPDDGVNMKLFFHLGMGFIAHAEPLGTVPSVTYVPLK